MLIIRNIFILIIPIFSLSHCASSDKEIEGIPNVIIENIERLEGDDGTLQIDYTVSLAESHATDVVLNYESNDASAFQGSDYQKLNGQLIIPAGSTEASITLNIVSDQIMEGNEFFRVFFESDMEVEFNRQTAEIKIKNDDSALPYETDDYSTPETYDDWKLAWADEFSETEINTEWWTHEIGNGDNGWGNNEMEYYTNGAENSRIEDGKLVIEARNDSWNGIQYTSARMVTKDKKTFSFSRTDIRAKLPYGQGIWPALWMLGNNIDDKGWPACGEIDILELVGHQPSTSHATVHWGQDYSNWKYIGNGYSLNSEIFNDRFHVFSVVREFNQMWFYVDDILIFDFTSKDTQGQPYPFNEQFFYIFNVAIGGNWPGSPDETTQFPQRMEVDYIRVFEKEKN